MGKTLVQFRLDDATLEYLADVDGERPGDKAKRVVEVYAQAAAKNPACNTRLAIAQAAHGVPSPPVAPQFSPPPLGDTVEPVEIDFDLL